MVVWGTGIATAGAPVRLVGPAAIHDRISALAVSPDGKLIAVLHTHDSNIFVSSILTWAKEGPVPSAMQGWGGLAFSGDGKCLVTGLTSGSVAMYGGLPGGDTQVRLGQHTGAVNCVACARKAKLIASGGDDNMVRLWAPDEGHELRMLKGHEGLICSVAVSADGKRIASASLDLTVRLWDATSGKQLHCLEDHHDQVHGLALSPDGKRLFTAGRDGLVAQWDVDTGKEVCRFEGHRGGTCGLSLSEDGKLLATAGDDGTVQVWDVATKRRQCRIDVSWDGVTAVALLPDGRSVVSADAMGAIVQWSARTGAKERSIGSSAPGHAAPLLARDLPDSARLECFTWSPDGRFLATGGADHWVRLWDAATGMQVHALGRHTDVVWSVAFSPDGKYVASAGRRDGLVHLWDVATGKAVHRFGRGHRGGISRLAWSVDGKYLLSGGGSFDPVICVWNGTTGRLLRRLEGHTNIVCGLALTMDNRWAATTASDGALFLWNLKSGAQVRGTALHATDLAFLHGSNALVTGCPWPQLMVLETEDGGDTWSLVGHERPDSSAVAVAPNGHMVASADDAGHIALWEACTGKQRAEVRLDGGDTIHHLAFCPTGLSLAVGTNRGVIIFPAPSGPDGKQPANGFGLLADWGRLADGDASCAWVAIRRLIAVKDRAVSLLGSRLRPVVVVPVKKMEQWARDLDNDSYVVRERATELLHEAGSVARPVLKRALAASPSPEAQRRIQDLLGRTSAPTTPDEIRMLRALEVLEEIDSPAARGVLQKMAGGDPEARATRVAQVALARLRR
jgi:WD40 repeat protein